MVVLETKIRLKEREAFFTATLSRLDGEGIGRYYLVTVIDPDGESYFVFPPDWNYDEGKKTFDLAVITIINVNVSERRAEMIYITTKVIAPIPGTTLKRLQVSSFVQGKMRTEIFDWKDSSSNIHRESVKKFVKKRGYSTQTLRMNSLLPAGYSFRLF